MIIYLVKENLPVLGPLLTRDPTTPDTLNSSKIGKDLIESQSPAENQKNLGGKKPIPVLSLNICVTWDVSLTSLSLNCLWKMKELEQLRPESPSRF